jgi:hypothetical protein
MINDIEELKIILREFGIEVPDGVDLNSVLWFLNEIYLRMNIKELKEFMNELEKNSLILFGNRK